MSGTSVSIPGTSTQTMFIQVPPVTDLVHEQKFEEALMCMSKLQEEAISKVDAIYYYLTSKEVAEALSLFSRDVCGLVIEFLTLKRPPFPLLVNPVKPPKSGKKKKRKKHKKSKKLKD